MKKNSEIWEEIYSQGDSNLEYPNEMFVRIFNKKFKGQGRVLDYGFGAGANLLHIAQLGNEAYGVEVSESAISLTKEKLKKNHLKADLKQIFSSLIPYEDEYFDVVVAWQVLVYNTEEDLKRALQEIVRVMKPGGLFIGTMTAEGDISHKLSEKVGEYEYVSRVPKQEGAKCIIISEENLSEFFGEFEIEVGKYYFEIEGVVSNHLIIVFNNNKGSTRDND